MSAGGERQIRDSEETVRDNGKMIRDNEEEGLPAGPRRLAMAAVILAVVISVLNGIVPNIALPSIAKDLRIESATSVWVVNAYQIAIAASLLPLAAFSEIVGLRRVHLAGLLIIVVSSVACVLAQDLPQLIAARVVQGIGASGILAVQPALVRFIYPSRMLGRGLGWTALAVATSVTLGPTLATVLLSFWSWPWLFAVNIPFGIVAILISIRSLPATPRATHEFDFIGAALAAGCLGLTIGGLSLAVHDRAVAIPLAAMALAVVLGAVVMRRHANHPAPMLPVDLFRNAAFALSVATSVLTFAAQGLAFVALPFLFLNSMGRSLMETGMLMMPWPLAVAALAPVVGPLTDRLSAAVLGGIGLVVMAIGLACLAALPADPGFLNIAWRMALCGCGFGLFQTPNMRMLISSSPRHRAGSAGGVAATSRLSGQAIGAALAALCFTVSEASGPVLALAAGAASALGASVASFMRLTVR